MEVLGIGPGREVGQAYAFLLELRMEAGPAEARAGRGRSPRLVGRARLTERDLPRDRQVGESS